MQVIYICTAQQFTRFNWHARVARSLSDSWASCLVTRTGRTSRTIVTIYASCDVILGKDVPFGGYVDMVHYLGGQIPQKLQFWRPE